MRALGFEEEVLELGTTDFKGNEEAGSQTNASARRTKDSSH